MNEGRLIFTQVSDMIHREQFERCVNLHPMPRASRAMTARDQFLAMLFAQLTYRESLRDIEACLRESFHLHAMGVRGNISRTNLAYANSHRDWRVYQALAHILIQKARRLYADDTHGLDIDEIVYAVDASTIDLCLSMFPWAKFKATKAAIKLHTQIDITGCIPVVISITEGAVHDVNFLDEMYFEAGSIYVFDRGYLDFERLYRINTAGGYFVIRSKKNTRFTVLESRPVDKSSGLRCDQIIRLSTLKGRKDYPERIRRIGFFDAETKKRLTFLTNNFEISALIIAAIYKNRWRIELFFKWIKQNLRIKVFYGTSRNAVYTQIWIAVCTYLMVACLSKTHGIGESLSRILQILSVNVFQKLPLVELVPKSKSEDLDSEELNQLILNGF